MVFYTTKNINNKYVEHVSASIRNSSLFQTASIHIKGYDISSSKEQYVEELLRLNPGEAVTKNYYGHSGKYLFEFTVDGHDKNSVEIVLRGKNAAGECVAENLLAAKENIAHHHNSSGQARSTLIPEGGVPVTLSSLPVTVTHGGQHVLLEGTFFTQILVPDVDSFAYGVQYSLYRDGTFLTTLVQNRAYSRRAYTPYMYYEHAKLEFNDVPGEPGEYLYTLAAVEVSRNAVVSAEVDHRLEVTLKY
ncbi:hypothetical protein GJU40_16785 [Bacillus lacus]|uniref:Uncharacterized protein n=1 Tax=Metabacillus lacus TaxID=1983721 RepID=A0A7X2J1U2_9BACI|nr:hypothetical protein [Metabacillus lacus]MRX73800.1 hypothetical protein [Metabacillus lacus]